MTLLSLSFLAVAGTVGATTITTDHLVAVNQTFDYIVVGGGLTGITVANKVCLSLFTRFTAPNFALDERSSLVKETPYSSSRPAQTHGMRRQYTMRKSEVTWARIAIGSIQHTARTVPCFRGP